MFVVWIFLIAVAGVPSHHFRCDAFMNCNKNIVGRSKQFATHYLYASSTQKQNDDGNINTSPKNKKRRRSWEESYHLLCNYKDINGHCNVPQSEKPLGTWTNTQRVEHAKYIKGTASSSMTAERKKLLDDICFIWDVQGYTWNTRYNELCEFRKINGHCVVPRYSSLGAWTEKQRIQYKKYVAMNDNTCIADDDESCKTILTEDRVKKLDSIGFVWKVRVSIFIL